MSSFRWLRNENAIWVTVLNHAFGGLVLPCGRIVLSLCDFEDFKIVLSAGTCYCLRLLAGARCLGGVTNFRLRR